MIDALTLQGQLEVLLAARASGNRRCRFSDGREIEYASGADLAAAIADTERRIAALAGRKVPRIVTFGRRAAGEMIRRGELSGVKVGPRKRGVFSTQFAKGIGSDRFPVSTPPPLYSEAEAARRLGLPVFTLMRERRDRRIGFKQVRRRIYYTEADLAAYIGSTQVQACPKTASRSEPSGSVNAPIVPRGAALGSISEEDRLAARHLAQMILKKRSSC